MKAPFDTAARGGREDVPSVGMVETASPSFSLYRTVVFPAASKPTGKQDLVVNFQ